MKIYAIIISIALHTVIFVTLGKQSSAVKKQRFASSLRLKTIKVELQLDKKEKKSKKKKSTSKKKELQQSYSEAKGLGQIRPIYPQASRMMGEEGSVKAQFEVNDNGKVSNIRIISSSGFKRLDKEVIRALKLAKFVPATRGKLSVRSTLEQKFLFKLKD